MSRQYSWLVGAEVREALRVEWVYVMRPLGRWCMVAKHVSGVENALADGTRGGQVCKVVQGVRRLVVAGWT